MIFYYANELRARRLPESDVQEASVLRRSIWNYLATGNGYANAKSELDRASTKRLRRLVTKRQTSFAVRPRHHH